jgi:signal peptidase II
MKINPVLLIGIGGAVALSDQVSKYAVSAQIQAGERVTALPNLLTLRHTQNPAGAYGALRGLDAFYRVPLLVVLPLLVFALIIWKLRDRRGVERSTSIALAFILGGAAGNLLDRIWRGHVVDFLVFRFGRSTTAAYNLADLCILGGMAAIALLGLRAWLQPERALPSSTPTAG